MKFCDEPTEFVLLVGFLIGLLVGTSVAAIYLAFYALQ
jgi:predicted membrane-bound spermidine synthase